MVRCIRGMNVVGECFMVVSGTCIRSVLGRTLNIVGVRSLLVLLLMLVVTGWLELILNCALA